MEVVEEVVLLFEVVVSFDFLFGIVDVDKQYWVNVKLFWFLKLVLKIGFILFMDYCFDCVGVKGGQYGGLFVEGDVYCLNMLKFLFEVIKDFFVKEIDVEIYCVWLEECRVY